MTKKTSHPKSKKTSKKKKTKKSDEPKVKVEIRIIKTVPKNKEFVLPDGRKLKDIRELAFALDDMADDIFWHHVNDFKNDFAEWIEDANKDKELAEEIRQIRDKMHAQVAILKHIVNKI